MDGLLVQVLSSADAGQTPAERVGQLRFAQAPPEFICGEIVHERVQAAVQAGQAQRDGVAALDQAPDGAVAQDVGFHQEVQGHGDVVGGEAQKEDHGAAQHHPQRPPLLPLVRDRPRRLPPQAPRRQTAAGQHQDQGDDEAQQLRGDQEGPRGRGADVPHGELCETHGGVGGLLGAAGPQQWEGQAAQEDQQPAHNADGQVSFTAVGGVSEGAHDELATTHADAHQEVDGGVHVDIFEIEADHTQGVPKGPAVVEVIVDTHGQREHLGGATRGQRSHFTSEVGHFL